MLVEFCPALLDRGRTRSRPTSWTSCATLGFAMYEIDDDAGTVRGVDMPRAARPRASGVRRRGGGLHQPPVREGAPVTRRSRTWPVAGRARVRVSAVRDRGARGGRDGRPGDGRAPARTAGYPVEILTTCAVDHHTWENFYEPGMAYVNGILVHRFPIERGNIKRQRAIGELIGAGAHDVARGTGDVAERGLPVVRVCSTT